ncbi:MAG: gamma-glutamylcyclotransferase [Bacteroidales bacterium]|nr:gamma-glutamylcyclotransferase [Bacteroidales bacterium]MDG2081454.1 gamma-glutamylcyclotransferase [Bacteroidales bacterium]|tara:strand:- start:491 stop:829 length:339 start_codon:yes stop_codon:yes gene_type:complete
MERLFSYGTLQLENVQRDTFGKLLIGTKDKLEKYVLLEIKITNPKVIESSGTNIHPILQYTGNETDIVEGTLFELTHEELISADEYEVEDYIRTEVTFESGKTGFVYLKNDQ